MGPAPITLHDIVAWEGRFFPPGIRFGPAELDLMKRLDVLALSEGN